MGISNANKSRPMWNQHEASRTRSQIVYISTTYTLCVWVCAIEPTCGTWRNLQATWFLSDSRAHVRAANISNMPGTNWKMFNFFFFADTKIDPLIWLQQCTIDDNRQFIQFVNADIWRWRFVFFPSVSIIIIRSKRSEEGQPVFSTPSDWLHHQISHLRMHFTRIYPFFGIRFVPHPCWSMAASNGE